MSLLSLHHLFFIAYIDLRKNMYSLNQYRSLTLLVFRLTPEFVYTFFFYSSVSLLFFFPYPSDLPELTRLDSVRLSAAQPINSSHPLFNIRTSSLPPPNLI